MKKRADLYSDAIRDVMLHPVTIARELHKRAWLTERLVEAGGDRQNAIEIADQVISEWTKDQSVPHSFRRF